MNLIKKRLVSVNTDVKDFAEWSENENIDIRVDQIGLNDEGLGEINLSDDETLPNNGN